MVTDRPARPSLRELFMRFAPPFAALAFALLLTSSVSWGSEPEASPAAAALIAEGRAALAGGETQKATDAFEAALTLDPAYTPILLDLGAAARADRLQGKAIGYYREALNRDPGNLNALAGEGAAYAEQGAVEKARGKLAQLQSLCGTDCPQASTLAAAIERGRIMPALAAETGGQPAQN